MTITKTENHTCRFMLLVMLSFYFFSVIGLSFFKTQADPVSESNLTFHKDSYPKTQLTYFKIQLPAGLKVKTGNAFKSVIPASFFTVLTQKSNWFRKDLPLTCVAFYHSFCRFCIIAKGP